MALLKYQNLILQELVVEVSGLVALDAVQSVPVRAQDPAMVAVAVAQDARANVSDAVDVLDAVIHHTQVQVAQTVVLDARTVARQHVRAHVT